MKLAIVHDDFVQFGGAEKVVLAASEVFPEAPIFTSVVSGAWREILEKKKIKVITSFMQNLPNVIDWNRQYALSLAYCLAFERFNFNDFDVVLSFSSRFAHGVVTRPETKHICYMHSPGRMFWEQSNYFSNEFGKKGILSGLSSFITGFPLSYIRLWDFTSAQRVDYFIANSAQVQKKISRYYQRDSQILHPFCETAYFSGSEEEQIQNKTTEKEDFFLVLSRLVSWKKIEIAIYACENLGVPLMIAGEGPDRKRLEKLAGKHTKFLGYVDEKKKKELLRKCKALILTQEEDFGITALEAMASGSPVVAYGSGGALETVVEGLTGTFFPEQNAESLGSALKNFNPSAYLREACFTRSKEFDRMAFQQKLKGLVESLYVPRS